LSARRAPDTQIERLTFTWTSLDGAADPPTGLDPATEIAQLRTALAHRDTIGMAKGMLMKRHDVDANAAFAILCRISQHSNTKLATVAADLVDRHSATRTIREAGPVVGRPAARSEPSPLRGT
jgi:ANTAR domain